MLNSTIFESAALDFKKSQFFMQRFGYYPIFVVSGARGLLNNQQCTIFENAALHFENGDFLCVGPVTTRPS